jgi:hypothetical protein
MDVVENGFQEVRGNSDYKRCFPAPQYGEGYEYGYQQREDSPCEGFGERPSFGLHKASASFLLEAC